MSIKLPFGKTVQIRKGSLYPFRSSNNVYLILNVGVIKEIFSIMRFYKIYYLVFTIAILFNSCSKDSNTLSEEEQGVSAEEGQEVEEGGAVQEEESTVTDPAARQVAQKLYDDFYEPSRTESTDVAWTGDEPSCNAGDVPENTMDKMLARIAYFRKAVGLNNTLVVNETKSEKAQEAALMMKANGALSHSPPETWKCYTESGSEGANKSLLALRTENAEAVDTYMEDPGAPNFRVGHRRWLLFPKLQEIGIGNTDNSNAIWVIGDNGTTPDDAPEFISWPPKGYVPQQLVYPRWSFSITDADFTGATINMNDQNGQSVPLSIEELNNDVGDNTIVWVPEGIQSNLNEDIRYMVTIDNIKVNGDTKSFTYEVIIFDPTK